MAQYDATFRDHSQLHFNHPPSPVRNTISAIINECGQQEYTQEVFKPIPKDTGVNPEIANELVLDTPEIQEVQCVQATDKADIDVMSMKVRSFVGLGWMLPHSDNLECECLEDVTDDYGDKGQQQSDNNEVHTETGSPVDCEEEVIVTSKPAQMTTAQNTSKEPQEAELVTCGAEMAQKITSAHFSELAVCVALKTVQVVEEVSTLEPKSKNQQINDTTLFTLKQWQKGFDPTKVAARKVTSSHFGELAACAMRPKTVQIVEEVSPLKPKKQRINATVRFVKKQWKREFPPTEEVDVRHKMDEYLNVDGHRVTLTITKVPFVEEKVFNNWHQLDGNNQLDIPVAYLEGDESGFSVKEQFSKSLNAAIIKIAEEKRMVSDEISKLDRKPLSVQQTKSHRYKRHRRLMEKDKLIRCFNCVICGMFNATEALHDRDYVSLRIRESNFFMRTNCDCWATAACVHDGYTMTVVLGGCDVAYPVGSVVTSDPGSKALQLAERLQHKYKTADIVYDKLDLAVTIVNLLTRFSDLDDCEEMTVGELLHASGVDHHVIQRMVEYCKLAKNHSTKNLQWEHEV